MRFRRWLMKSRRAGPPPNVTSFRNCGRYKSKRQTNGDSTGPLSAGSVCVALVLIGASLSGVQKREEKQEDKTAYLVARRSLSDPFFARSAVLMLPSSDLPLVIGLIINRPTHVELRQLFPQNRALQGKTETAYFGGPVDINDLSVVFRTSQPPKGAMRLVNDVYVSFDPQLMDALVTNPQGTQDVRFFLGRSQWAPAQLQNEILQGAWYNVEAESKLIFGSDPQQVWRTLLNRAQPANVVDYNVPTTVWLARLARREDQLSDR